MMLMIFRACQLPGFPVLGKTADYMNYKDCEFVIAVGNPSIREKIAEALDVKWHTAVHPKAVISKLDVEIGEGTDIMANALLTQVQKSVSIVLSIPVQ